MRQRQKTVVDKEKKIKIKFKYNKCFSNDKYELYFNTRTGFELLRGVNGYKDPFMTELPTLLDIGIMGHCVNKCPTCYQGDKFQEHMTLDNFKRIIDEVKDHANQVALGGRGDPNLHPNFKEIIEYARNNNVIPNYTTSGNGLTDDQVKISKMCGAVAVSDYRQSYSYLAMKKFVAAKIKTNVHFTLTRANFNDALIILYGYNPWRKRDKRYESKDPEKESFNINKLNGVVFLLFKPQGRGLGRIDLIPTPIQLKQFAELIIAPGCSIKVGMDSCLVNHVIQHVNLSEIQRMSVDTCESARMSTYITPDMKMVPCSFACHEKMGVPLKNKTIERVWKHSRPFRNFRKRLKKPCCPAMEILNENENRVCNK